MSFSKRANMARKRYAQVQRRIDRFISVGAGIVLFAVFAYIIVALGQSAGLW